MLHAAAAALQLAADGRITARGVLGSAIQPSALSRVYEGAPPSPFRTAWIDFAAAVQEALDHARIDPDHARQLLAMLILGRHNREVHEQEIAFLLDNGVPAGFLPNVAELDRLFPLDTPEQAGGGDNRWAQVAGQRPHSLLTEISQPCLERVDGLKFGSRTGS